MTYLIKAINSNRFIKSFGITEDDLKVIKDWYKGSLHLLVNDEEGSYTTSSERKEDDEDDGGGFAGAGRSFSSLRVESSKSSSAVGEENSTLSSFGSGHGKNMLILIRAFL